MIGLAVAFRSACVIAATVLAVLAAAADADAAPVFQQVSPDPASYVFGVFGDFTQYPGTALGDVTGELEAVDLALPPVPGVISVSGCTAGDFAGFVAGSIALLERGSCTFGQKAANAAAAGAIGALIFNDGPAVNVALSVAAGIPTLITSFDVGSALAAELATGDVVVRIDVTSLDDNIAPTVAEPGTAVLFGGGLALLGLGRWRQRAGG
jgi:hypothetical protein